MIPNVEMSLYYLLFLLHSLVFVDVDAFDVLNRGILFSVEHIDKINIKRVVRFMNFIFKINLLRGQCTSFHQHALPCESKHLLLDRHRHGQWLCRFKKGRHIYTLRFLGKRSGGSALDHHLERAMLLPKYLRIL